MVYPVTEAIIRATADVSKGLTDSQRAELIFGTDEGVQMVRILLGYEAIKTPDGSFTFSDGSRASEKEFDYLAQGVRFEMLMGKGDKAIEVLSSPKRYLQRHRVFNREHPELGVLSPDRENLRFGGEVLVAGR